MKLHRFVHGGGDYPWWLAYVFDNPVRRMLHKPRQLLEPYVPEGAVVVDLGCGMGYFTGALAELVGPGGRVHGVDRQNAMLDRTRRRMDQGGVTERVSFHLAPLRDAGLASTVDFVLAFWMLHEARGKGELLSEVHAALKPGGRLLLVEPLGHVGPATFQRETDLALDAGFIIDAEPSIALSRALLLARPSVQR